MAVIEQNDTKQQIIEKLDSLSPAALKSLLDYAQFISLDSQARNLLTAPYDEEELSEQGRAMIQEALDDPRPSIPDEDFRKELGL